MAVTKEDIETELGPCDEAKRVGSPSGMGECWRVVRGTDVIACKVVRPGDDARFDRELTAMSRLSSPRVAAVRSHGTMRVRADGTDRRYFLSDFIEGGDALVNAKMALPSLLQLRAFLDGTLEGLAELHAANVIHRDIKPENIVLRGGDWANPVVIDLGLSRLPDLTSVTHYPWFGGTWHYMAPEQLAQERATERSDIWALAVVGFVLATGRHPFLTPTDATMPHDWDQRLQSNVPPTGASPGLDAWLTATGQYAGYKRPDARGARKLLGTVWP
ncbi:MAG TPA: serine/threonine-protein kinase [Conexibacter sp.]|jgi:serine/threonine protein kinase